MIREIVAAVSPDSTNESIIESITIKMTTSARTLTRTAVADVKELQSLIKSKAELIARDAEASILLDHQSQHNGQDTETVCFSQKCKINILF